MAIDVESWIAEQVNAFCQGRITVSQFNDALAPYAWSDGNSVSALTQDLLHQVELGLAEYSAGHATVEQLQGEFLVALGLPAVTT